LYQIPRKSKTRDPEVFDKFRIIRKVRKLLARYLKPKLANNVALETTNEDNAAELYGLEFYWWKFEIADQEQEKVEWNRYHFQYQNPEQTSSNSEEQTLQFNWSIILIKLKELLYTCNWLNVNETLSIPPMNWTRQLEAAYALSINVWMNGTAQEEFKNYITARNLIKAEIDRRRKFIRNLMYEKLKEEFTAQTTMGSIKEYVLETFRLLKYNEDDHN
jgi:hypothetical protein